jgi:hypothetical protein
MRTLALLAFLGCAAVAQAQQPKTYAPETAPRANEETVLNARVVSVDVAGARLTVRGVDVKADGGRDETYSVAAPAASGCPVQARWSSRCCAVPRSWTESPRPAPPHRGTAPRDRSARTPPGAPTGAAVRGRAETGRRTRGGAAVLRSPRAPARPGAGRRPPACAALGGTVVPRTLPCRTYGRRQLRPASPREAAVLATNAGCNHLRDRRSPQPRFGGRQTRPRSW